MVLYFTGTGNSRHIAERIAHALNDTLISLNDRIKSGDVSPDLMRWYFMAAFSAASFLSCSSLAISSSKSCPAFE